MKKEIFIKWILFLETKEVSYALLGNTLTYPEKIGSDVDLVVNKETFVVSRSLVEEFCSHNGYFLCNCLQHEITASYYVVAAIDEQNKQVFFLAIDICSDYYRENRKIISSSTLLADRKKVKLTEDSFYYICNDSIAFTYYFIKKLEKKSINIEQFEYLMSLWRNASPSIKEELIKNFSQDKAQKIAELFDVGKLEDIDKKFILNCKSELTTRYKVSFRDWLKNGYRIIQRIRKPTGLVVAFMGCDGSGKSTIINLVRGKRFHEEAFRGNAYFHLYPFRKKNHSATIESPHGQKKRSFLMSNLKLGYFLIKYTIGYWRYVFPEKAKSNLIIFDRYFHDIMVDPVRYRHGGSSFLTRMIGKMIPAPEIFFFIDASTEAIQSRKKEVSWEESERQRNAYIQLNNSLKNAVLISNESSPEVAAFQIEKSMIMFLAKRYSERK